jgi:hypothetical protein
MLREFPKFITVRAVYNANSRPTVGLRFGVGLLSYPAQNVKDNRQNDTDNDRCGQGEVEGRVFATIKDVAGQAADRQMGPAQQQEHDSQHQQQPAEEDQDLTDLGHSFQFNSPPPDGSRRALGVNSMLESGA